MKCCFNNHRDRSQSIMMYPDVKNTNERGSKPLSNPVLPFHFPFMPRGKLTQSTGRRKQEEAKADMKRGMGKLLVDCDNMC